MASQGYPAHVNEAFAIPAAQKAATTTYTQTFTTATRTVPNATAAALTNANGTADGTFQDVTASPTQTTVNNNFQECSTQINALIVDVAELRKVVTAIIDDLQKYGFLD